MFNFFRRSLSNTLIGIVAFVTIATAVLVSGYALRSASNALETSAIEKLGILAESREIHIITIVKMRWWQLEQIASEKALTGFLSDHESGSAEFDANLVNYGLSGHFESLALADLNGKIIASTKSSEHGASIAKQDWFQRALTTPTVTDLYMGEGVEEVYRTTFPVRDLVTDAVVGVITGVSDAEQILTLLDDHEGLGATGEAYLMNAEGLLLSPSRHESNAAFRLKNTAGAYHQAIELKKVGGGRWVNYLGKEVLGSIMFDDFSRDLGVNWVIVAEAEIEEVNQPVVSLRDQVTLVSALIVVVTIFFGYFMARSISNPIIKLAETATRVGQGDLTVSLGESKRIDEIGSLHSAFVEMTEGLRQIINEMQAGMGQLSTSTAQISATAQQTATTAAEQSSTVAEVSTTTEEISQTSKAAAESAADVVEASEQAVNQGREGLAKADNAVGIMQTISERVEGIASKILELSEQNSQIGEIIETVNDLAEQSNLLAVNASIEAAKAGEQGLGFSVVASEVRSLAEQSKRAALQIRVILREIQKATESAVMATEEGNKRVVDGLDSINMVRAVIEELAAVLENNSDHAQQIAGAARQQASGISQISEAMAGVASAGEESVKGADQLEMAATNLSALAKQIEKSTGKYKT